MTSLSTAEEKTQLEIVLNIIKRKADHKKEGDAIARLEMFYKNELKDIHNKLHKVGGEYITIDSMEDDHLYNTIKKCLINNFGNWSSVNSKYIEEAKKRPALMERILSIDKNEIVPLEYDEEDEFII